MKRVQAFEFNDQPWLPEALRAYGTDYLEALLTRMGVYQSAAPLIARTLEKNGIDTLVDLCSGAGGPILAILDPLSEALGRPPRITLTDKFPNEEAFSRLVTQSGGRIEARSAPVDVLAVPDTLPGMRTMFDALHHFRPSDVRKILEDAARAGVPIASFDGANRTLPVIVGSIFIPILVLLLTPIIRPFRIGRIVFTYLIPIMPLLIMFDGFVSHMRGHTAAELEAIGREITSQPGLEGYRFETGELKAGPGAVTYIVGSPAG